MWSCDGCGRHLLPGTPVCPFCAGRKVAGLGMAALTPLVLSACYGAPPCDADDLVDADGDGHYTTTAFCSIDELEDCDDTNGDVHPGAEEICGNGIDDDCDPSTPDTCPDEEGDRGHLEIRIDWDEMTVADCEEAGLTQLDVSVKRDGEEPEAAIVQCADAGFTLESLRVGEYKVEVVGAASGDRTWRSGVIEAEVVVDQTNSVWAALTCEGSGC